MREVNDEHLPKVAIVGRPNVGKSTCFNRLTGKRKAIVDDMPGVTRDRQYGLVDWNGHSFWVIDTGGFDPKESQLEFKVSEQIQQACDEAALVLFLVDAKAGLLNEEVLLSKMLRKLNKPVILILNKVDHDEVLTSDFYQLGFDLSESVSSESGRNFGEMLDLIVKNLNLKVQQNSIPSDIKIAIMGRPNVGKSSLLNQILGEERAVVHDQSGTTRDTMNIFIRHEDKIFEFVDTAGIRRRKQTEGKVEKVSIIKAQEAMDQAHVILIMVEGPKGLTAQDLRVLGYAEKAGKGIILIYNKWDLMPNGSSLEELRKDFLDRYPTLNFIRTRALSAKTGRGVKKLFTDILENYENCTRKISTSELNQFFEEIKESHPHPNQSGLNITLKYITQSGQNPPWFKIFMNHPKKILPSYLRYLENKMRKRWDFSGTPIRLVCVKK